MGCWWGAGFSDNAKRAAAADLPSASPACSTTAAPCRLAALASMLRATDSYTCMALAVSLSLRSRMNFHTCGRKRPGKVVGLSLREWAAYCPAQGSAYCPAQGWRCSFRSLERRLTLWLPGTAVEHVVSAAAAAARRRPHLGLCVVGALDDAHVVHFGVLLGRELHPCACARNEGKQGREGQGGERRWPAAAGSHM